MTTTLKAELREGTGKGVARKMRQAGRVPNPHSFTHGTSEQRMRWFATGFDSGDIGQCDTFAADRL